MRFRPFASALAVSTLSVAVLAGSAAPVVAHDGDHTCVFTVSLTEGSEVGNLDLVLNYAGLDGDIEGTNPPVCRLTLGGSAFVAFKDKEDTRQLLAGIIRLNPFSAPSELFRCRVFWDTELPVPADFPVVVTNASRSGSDEQIKPTPKVKVTSVDCPGDLSGPTTTTTTSTTSTTVTSTSTSSTLPLDGACGFPASDGERPTAADSLATLKAAVGLGSCALCVCDIDDSGKVTASDALGILKAAVGIEVELACPACDA